MGRGERWYNDLGWVWWIVGVVCFLALAAWVATPKFGRDGNLRVIAANADIVTLEMALGSFQLEVGRYPTTAEGLRALVAQPAGATGWKGPYLRQPLHADPWGHPYQYSQPGRDGKPFDLWSYGPDGVPSRDDIRAP